MLTCKVLLLSLVFKQLYERRKKCATGQEVSVIQSLSEKYMTEEETDSDDDTTLEEDQEIESSLQSVIFRTSMQSTKRLCTVAFTDP